MSEFLPQEVIVGYQYSIGQEAALAMNGLLTMSGRTYPQMKAGEGVAPEVHASFTLFEETAGQYLGFSALNDTLMHAQKGTSPEPEAKPVVLELATKPLLESFLSQEQIETRLENQTTLDTAVYEIIEPVHTALIDKIPVQAAKKPFYRRNNNLPANPQTEQIVRHGIRHHVSVLRAESDTPYIVAAESSFKVSRGDTSYNAPFSVSLCSFDPHQSNPHKDDGFTSMEVTWRNRHQDQLTRKVFEQYGAALTHILEKINHHDGGLSQKPTENTPLYRGVTDSSSYMNRIVIGLADQTLRFYAACNTFTNDSAVKSYNFDPDHNVFSGTDGAGKQLAPITVSEYLTLLTEISKSFPLIEIPPTSGEATTKINP